MVGRMLCASLLPWLFAGFAVGALPPLDDRSLAILETAVDDQDHQEAAFAMLAEEALRRSGDSENATGFATPTPEVWAQWVAHPASARGRPVRLEGRVEQVTPLARPWETFSEAFIRLPQDTVLAVFSPRSDALRVGQRVRLEGRFYKRLSAVARDGRARVYPAVVARRGAELPWRPALPLVLIGLLGVGGVWWLVRRAAAAARTSGRPAPQPLDSAPTSMNPSELPDEPAQALDVLRSRHDHPEEGGAP